jgi:hypothetical protein
VTKAIQVQSKVGHDGVLRIPLTPADADADVRVTIEPITSGKSQMSPQEWRAFLNQTYGSCAGLGLEEPEDLPLEEREPLE